MLSTAGSEVQTEEERQRRRIFSVHRSVPTTRRRQGLKDAKSSCTTWRCHSE